VTLLDRWALIAPPVPDWFEPKIPEPKPLEFFNKKTGERMNVEDIPENERQSLGKAIRDKEIEEMRRQRLIQWPYAWAALQMAERARHIPAESKA
jgi:hypothetical protein